jgi:tetrahydromethanopterin S-methyltransferase subunit F
VVYIQIISICSVSDRTTGQEDPNGYIKNWESEIDFRIDDKFMIKLEDFGVDANPTDGTVRFQLNCEVNQGSNSLIQRESVDIRIERKYDNGAIAADTIGIIVGVIIAVAILIVIVVLLLVAKSRKIWCFAENEFAYQEPGDKQKQPRNRDVDTRQGQQQRHQVQDRFYSIRTDAK